MALRVIPRSHIVAALDSLQNTLESIRRQHANRTAIVHSNERITYRVLHERADNLATTLSQLSDHNKDRVVAVQIGRSIDLVVAILGILKSGAAYLPVDPDLPVARREYIFAEAGVSVCITSEATDESTRPAGDVLCIDIQSAVQPGPAASSQQRPSSHDLAYVMFTSGSTGTPKGVMVERRSLFNLTRETVDLYEVSAGDRILQFASPNWDTSLEEILPALATGAALVLRTESMLNSLEAFAEECAASGVTVMDLPTAFWSQLVSAETVLPQSLRLVVVGGEAVPMEAVRRWHASPNRHVRLINTYGLTEATAVSTMFDLSADTFAPGKQAIAPIGMSIPNCTAYVLDSDGLPAAEGESGEIFIGGVGVARGYAGRPDLTTERFIPDPQSSSNASMYRTGDIGYRDTEGILHYVGRADNQVKIRGHRVELEEVEAVLAQDDGVGEVAVVVTEHAGMQSLSAFIVAGRPHSPGTSDQFMSVARCLLPSYMVPSSITLLDSLPLHPNGKVDRAELRHLGSERRGNHSPANVSAKEAELVKAVSNVLGIAVNASDNFFEAGGDSISALLLVSELSKKGLALTTSMVFETPVLSGLAQRLGANADSPPGLSATAEGGPYPLTPMQEGVLFESLAAPDSQAYVDQDVWQLQGDLDIVAFERAWGMLFERHATLRTRFSWRGLDEPRQEVLSVDEAPPYWTYLDWSDSPTEETNSKLRAFLSNDLRSGMPPDAALLSRFAMIRLGDGKHIFVWTIHRLIVDGWSTTILLNELVAIYAALLRETTLDLHETTPFQAFVAVARDEQRLARDGRYWQTYLLDAPPSTPIPSDLSTTTPDLPREYVHWRESSQDLGERVARMCRELGITTSTLVRGVWGLTLARLLHRSDVVFGATTSGRSPNLPHADTMVGLFITTLPIRVRERPDATAADWLRELQMAHARHSDHELMPLSQIQRLLGSRQGEELFQSLVVVQTHPGASSFDRQVGRASMRHIASVDEVHYPICLTVEQDHRLTFDLSIRSDRVDAEHGRILLRSFLDALEQVLSDPLRRLREVSTVSRSEKDRLIRLVNGDLQEAPRERTFLELFNQTVINYPDRVAVVEGDDSTTYVDLDRSADQLAQRLSNKGVVSGDNVCVAVPRSREMILSVLAVMKCAAAYVPVDVDLPEAALRQILDASRPRLVITTDDQTAMHASGASTFLVDDKSAARRTPLDSVRTDAPAYVIFTSGSTGTPKGVEVPQRALANYCAAVAAAYNISASDRVFQGASLSFDWSVLEIFPPLSVGATIVLREARTLDSIASLLAFLDRQRVTTLFLPTALWHQLVIEMEAGAVDLPGTLRLISLGGERAIPEFLRRWRRLPHEGPRLFNGYGPTETTVEATICDLDAVRDEGWEEIPIGRPIENVRAYVLDQFQQPVPLGIAGEIVIGGLGVSSGYLRDPRRTSERFVVDQLRPLRAGDMMYRTGDVGRILPDGNLEFLGRLDDQVQVRGFRVELGQVESALVSLERVTGAAVLPYESSSGEVVGLIAYVTGDTAYGDLEPKNLREYLKSRLASHMIPSRIVVLDTLPKSSTGKVDRRALKSLTVAVPPTADSTPPRTKTEKELVRILEDVLETTIRSVRDDFLALGGHSIAAMHLVARIQRDLQIDVPLRAVFEHPVIADLAAYITKISPETSQAATNRAATMDRLSNLPVTASQRMRLSRDERARSLGLGDHRHHIEMAFDLRGELDSTALELALGDLIRRHPALRTTFHRNHDGYYQSISPHASIELGLIDLAHLADPKRRLAVDRFANEIARAPFDLGSGPLLRAGLARLASEHHVFAITLEHIISDTWSIDVLLRELCHLYEARRRGEDIQPPLAADRYVDYLFADEEDSSNIRRDVGLWRDRLPLGGRVQEILLPRAVAGPAGIQGGRSTVQLDAATSLAVRAIQESEQATPFMCGLAATAAFLTATTGQRELSIRTPFANRDSSDYLETIAWMSEVLIITLPLDGRPSFRELVRRTRQATLDAWSNRSIPFYALLEKTDPEEYANPVGKSYLWFDSVAAGDSAASLRLEGVRASSFELADGTWLQLTALILENRGGSMSLTADYNAGLYPGDSMRHTLEEFGEFLSEVARVPDRRLTSWRERPLSGGGR
jgi:amino acid adenylation domain-containing protein